MFFPKVLADPPTMRAFPLFAQALSRQLIPRWSIKAIGMPQSQFAAIPINS
jgi:hypothetical protein